MLYKCIFICTTEFQNFYLLCVHIILEAIFNRENELLFLFSARYSIGILKGNMPLQIVLVLCPTSKVGMCCFLVLGVEGYLIFKAPKTTITLLGKYLNFLSKWWHFKGPEQQENMIA